jgi:ABC-2 type transport system permease protein
MKRLQTLIWKEFRQLTADPAGLRLMIFPVLIQVFVLSYAITTEVRNITVTICDRSITPQSQSLIASITHNTLFIYKGMSQSESEVRLKLDNGSARLGLVIPSDFSKTLETPGGAHVSLLIDGQDAGGSNVSAGYLNAIVSTWALNHFTKKLEGQGISFDNMMPVHTSPCILFNPLLNSTWYMVPALAVLLVTMISALLTSFSIVREKESGTLEQLLVTPVKSWEIVVGKTIPFLIIGLIELAAILILASLWFGIPFKGNILVVALFAIIYMISTLGIGTLTSAIAKTPYQALFMIWFILLFFILLSGFFLPLENMPIWVQQVTRINPVRYFMFSLREIFLKGSGIADLWREAISMLVIGVIVYGLALLAFKRRIG